MNELFVEKLRNGMQPIDLYKELVTELHEADAQVKEERNNAAKNKEKLREQARAHLVSAMDLYGQSFGNKPLTEEEANKMAEEWKQIEAPLEKLAQQINMLDDEGMARLLKFAATFGL